MLIKIITLFFLFLTIRLNHSQTKYWEQFTESEQEDFLINTSPHINALNFIKSNFNATDDSLTFDLLDSLTSGINFNPFYFYIFNIIFEKSDGALTEVMPNYIFNFILNFPREIIGYFKYETDLNHENNKINLYAEQLGWELKISGKLGEYNQYSYIDFKNYLEAQLSNSDYVSKQTLKIFTDKIEYCINK